MSGDIVFVSGSPSPSSRSAFVAHAVGAHATRAGVPIRAFSVLDFDAADVLSGRTGALAVQAFLQAVAGCAAIVLSTPVYKATYAGGLKALVDLIPPDALVSKPALGIATTKQRAHGAGVDHGYRALFAFFRARTVDTLVVVDDELLLSDGHTTPSPSALARVDGAARELLAAIDSGPALAAAR